MHACQRDGTRLAHAPVQKEASAILYIFQISWYLTGNIQKRSLDSARSGSTGVVLPTLVVSVAGTVSLLLRGGGTTELFIPMSGKPLATSHAISRPYARLLIRIQRVHGIPVHVCMYVQDIDQHSVSVNHIYHRQTLHQLVIIEVTSPLPAKKYAK